MTIESISAQMVQLLRNQDFLKAQRTFFDEQVISQEPSFHPQPRTVGLSALMEKERQFLTAIQTWHEFEISEPLVSRDHFSIRMYSKVTLQTGRLLEIDEVIVYQIANGKIVRETYFYQQP